MKIIKNVKKIFEVNGEKTVSVPKRSERRRVFLILI